MDDARLNVRELGKAAAALVHLLRSDLVELRQKVDAEGKNIPEMLNEFRKSWYVVQAFIKGHPAMQEAQTNTGEKNLAGTDTDQVMEQALIGNGR